MGSIVFRIAGSGGGGGTCADGSWVTGKVGSYALDFDTTDDYVTMGAANSTESNALQPSAGTYAAWVKMDALRSGFILGATEKGNTGGANKKMHGLLAWNRASKLNFYVNAGKDTASGNTKLVYNVATNSDAGYSLNTWYHLAMTWPTSISAGTDLKFYINGADVTDTSSPSYWGGSSFNATSDRADREFLLGMGNRDAATPSMFGGKLDEVGIWDVQLDSGAITELYNSGNGYAANNVSSSNLVAYYSFEEGAGNSTLTDRGSNGYNGTLTNMDTGSC